MLRQALDPLLDTRARQLLDAALDTYCPEFSVLARGRVADTSEETGGHTVRQDGML